MTAMVRKEDMQGRGAATWKTGRPAVNAPVSSYSASAPCNACPFSEQYRELRCSTAHNSSSVRRSVLYELRPDECLSEFLDRANTKSRHSPAMLDNRPP